MMNKKLILIGNIFNHKDLFLKLFSFDELKEGWNAGSGLPISSKVILKTAYILSDILSNEIEVFPTERDSIQLEWDKFEIEIFDKYNEKGDYYGVDGFILLPKELQ